MMTVKLFVFKAKDWAHPSWEGAGKVSGQNTGNLPPLEVTRVSLPKSVSRDLLVKRDRGHLSREKAENTFYFLQMEPIFACVWSQSKA